MIFSFKWLKIKNYESSGKIAAHLGREYRKSCVKNPSVIK